MRRFIEEHFGSSLLLFCFIGLLLPGLDRIPNQLALVILALLMFISCYKLREGGFGSIRWRDIAWFYGLRYLLLPMLLWTIARLLAPDYATGVFLLSVLPAAVSSPAFATIYNGVAPPAFAVVIISQLLTPLMIPLQFAFIGVEGGPSPLSLFTTMVWCIFLPMGLYAVLRHHKRSADYLYRQNKFFSMLLVALVIMMAIAKQREVILSHVSGLIVPLMIVMLCFSAYIIFGWWFARNRPASERVTYATCSAFNNAALGVTLALLHFPPSVQLFIAVSEIGWSLLPSMLKFFLKRVN